MILLGYYGVETPVFWKGKSDPVTDADRAANDMLVEELRRLFPQDGVLSEEGHNDAARFNKSRGWIIDPMDGTREFIDHRDEFAVMIGLAVDGIAKLGVIYQPTTRKIYYAESGSGAFLAEKGAARPLTVSSETDLSRMAIALSRSHHSPQVDLIRNRLGIKGAIVSGSIGLKVGLICEGRAHVYLHTGSRTSQWDTCAPEAILREAGGRITDACGGPLSYNVSELRNLRGVIASNGVIHDRVVETAKSVLAVSA